MIKVTQLLFEISEQTQEKIREMQAMYNEELERAEITGGPTPPEPKPWKLTEDDYDKTEVNMYLDPTRIESISQNLEGDTQIETFGGKTIYVLESVEMVYELKLKSYEQ